MGRHRKSPRSSFWLPPAPTSPASGHDPGNNMKILFNMFSIFYLWWHTQRFFGIKFFEIDMLMIFDLLTSPQGHQFDPRMKMLPAFCTARHHRRLDMPHDHVWNYFFWPPGHSQCPKVPPLGHDPGDRIKIPSDMFCIFHLWEHTWSLV